MVFCRIFIEDIMKFKLMVLVLLIFGLVKALSKKEELKSDGQQVGWAEVNATPKAATVAIFTVAGRPTA